jgi:probable addiction module antidote protein
METAVLEIPDIDEPAQGYLTLSDWDPTEDIKTKEIVIVELDVALEENDPAFLLSVMKDIVRSEGFTEVARELGLTPASLRHTIAPAGALAFESVIKLLDLMGFRLRVAPKSA